MEPSTSTVSPKKGLSYALTSGVFASIAGTFGKFAMTRSETVWYCENICISPYVSLAGDDASAFCDRVWFSIKYITLWNISILMTLNYFHCVSNFFSIQGALYFQGVAMIMMILMNALMWTTFVKALRFCHTSLEATVTNTAANFFCSVIMITIALIKK